MPGCDSRRCEATLIKLALARDDADQACAHDSISFSGCWPAVMQSAPPVGVEPCWPDPRSRGHVPAVVPYAFALECSTVWSMRLGALRDVLELTPSGISHATRVRALIQAIALMLQPKRCSLTLALYVSLSLSLSLSLPPRAWNLEGERGGGW